MKLKGTGERGFLKQLIPQLVSTDPAVRIGPGDDAAVVSPPPGHDLVLTCDMLVEGIHFRPEYFSWDELGSKSITVSVSDLAAMGAEPAWALVSVGLPGDTPESVAHMLMQGMLHAAAAYGLSIIGGDTVRSPVIVIDVFAAGLCRPGQAVTRSGAGIGDTLVVTGDLGASAAGLAILSHAYDGSGYARLIDAHRRPDAQLSAARALTRAVQPTAMIDISDGLASEVTHLCTASQVGARIDGACVPIADDTRRAAADLNLDPMELALSGGEDYQLLATLKADAVSAAIEAAASAETVLNVIGTIVPPDLGITIDIEGTDQPISRYQGFDAFATGERTSGSQEE